jgi:manganese transport protein
VPHALYLHSALVIDRFSSRLRVRSFRFAALDATRVDVVLALMIAGVVNLAMLLAGAGALQGSGVASLDDVHARLGSVLGSGVALLFALALLASGFASSSVGTYAGSVILQGFLRRQVPRLLRRLVTLIPALVLIAAGADPTRMLVLSQVVLSFGIPFALWPLVALTRDPDVMGDMVNRGAATFFAVLAATAVTVLNVVLVALTITGCL